MAAIHKTLTPPKINGDESGDLLVVGWGSTLGAIEEAVSKARKMGGSVSSLHLRFLSPVEPGLEEIFKRFKKVMTVEINYGDEENDPLITPENRRRTQLSWFLRAHTLTDVDFLAHIHGQPMRPGFILQRLKKELGI
jgi:2-oxoglutarate ferredoxin oxidoreductase subunit alpha